MNTPSKPRSFLGAALMLGVLALVTAHPALAADDIFASGKEIIKAAAGKGSTIEMAMLTSGLFVGAVAGFTTRNWMAAVGGFAGGMIFWNVTAPLVGLA